MTRVLIVDDEPSYRMLLSQLFDGHGCETRAADGAHSAIDIASEFRPQVVVADWMLRDFHDGLDLLFALRHAGIACPVILMSGYPSDELVADASAGGVYRFFPKPFEPDEMVAAVLAATDPTAT